MTQKFSEAELIAAFEALVDNSSPRQLGAREALLRYLNDRTDKARKGLLRARLDDALLDSLSPPPADEKFHHLADAWRKNRGPTSSVSQMAMQPEYQAIIGMGPDALPLILDELRLRPDHWFWALAAITGEDPVPQEDKGKLPEMAKAWIDWGREHAYLDSEEVPPPTVSEQP